ncbi:hypothetical protein [Streptomyces sp. R35]|uniref:Barstar (barnase inhibitor) domain-containing protein n=1 Tax=Streptomyces sp. R35 TaxID=3238630 RepID=A0AB39SE25_9ACTN
MTYGSRPGNLPGFMNDPNDDDGSQVVKLDHAESRELEALSLNRFPPTVSAGLDWDSAVYDERRSWGDEDDWAKIAADLLTPYVSEGRRVAVFWGDLRVPTVTIPAETAVRHARKLLSMEPHFWIYPLGGPVLIECLMDGQVTVAPIPSG